MGVTGVSRNRRRLPAGRSTWRPRSPQLTGPDGTAALIDQLRADGTVLTYDPDGRTLRAGGHDVPAVTIATDAVGTHLRQGKKRGTAWGKAEREHPPRPEAERG